MKKVFILLMLLISMAFPQSAVEEYFYHTGPVAVTDSIHADVTSMYIMQFSGRGTTLSALADLDEITNVNQIPGKWNILLDAKFNGYLIGDVTFTGTGALDSLQIKVYPIDKYGYVIVNDYVWGTSGTPPSFSTTVSYLSFTTAVTERFDLSGAFGLGTYGILIYVIQTNETATDVANMNLKIYHN
jgi:hypothetical protein